MDEIDVPSHPFGKRLLRSVFGVVLQEMLVGPFVHS